MAGDDKVSGDDAERGTPLDERRRIVRKIIDAVRNTPHTELPERLSRACAELLPVTGLSVSLTGGKPELHTLLCASDGVAARLAEIQFTLGEGPGLRAVTLRAPVFAEDLRDGPGRRRWPLFAAQAAMAGAAAVFALPLGNGVKAMGTLDLYRDYPGALTEAEIRTALLTADALALTVASLQQVSADADGVVPWLAGAEADHEEVYQATGMIMVQLGLTVEEALLRLRARAFADGRTATEVARDIIDRTVDLSRNG